MSMIKRYLIIDDVTDSGDTLRTAVGYVKGQGAREIKTGVFAA
jgi:hypoxanthine phosphoribosyltransferase